MLRICSWFFLLAITLTGTEETVLRQSRLQPFSMPKTADYRLHGFPSISPDHMEMIWPVLPPRILMSRFVGGKWSPPYEAPFSRGNIQAAVFSPDGSRIYFQARLPGGLGSLDIWYVQRQDGNWSSPVNLGRPVNSDLLESQPSVTRKGHLYFTGQLEGSGWNRGIYRSEYHNGCYQKPQLLNRPINTEAIDMYPFIHPDEKYLVFSSSRPGIEEKNLALYVSHRTPDGRWLTPVNLGKQLGLKGAVRFGSISADGRFLRFMHENRIYQLETTMIPHAGAQNAQKTAFGTGIQKLTRLSPASLLVAGTPYDSRQLFFQSEKGLVLVDSGISPEYGRLLKKVGERAFPGQTVRYLINTHHHWDHTQGNQEFGDALVFAQHDTLQAMIRQADDHDLSETPQTAGIQDCPPPPPRPTRSRSSEGFSLTLPSVLVADRLTLNLGDLTLELAAFPGCHSPGDLIVWAKETGIAATGDLIFKNTLPILNRPQGFVGPQYLVLLSYLLDAQPSIKLIVPGHGDPLTQDELKDCRRYITRLLEESTRAVARGESPESLLKTLSLPRGFPELQGQALRDRNNDRRHEDNIRGAHHWCSLQAQTESRSSQEEK